MTDLGTVGTDPCSRGIALNAKGQIVGGSTNCQTFLHAFIWENGGPMVDLNTLVASGSDLTLTEALFINDAGEIAGNGVLQNGDSHAFVLIPCDENHPGVEGCDYSLVEASATATVSTMPTTLLPTDAIRQSMKSFGLRSRLWYRGVGTRSQK
jgi:probable HAF family extracellular repeat protein